MTDTGTPLCNWPQFTQGAFADLARNITDPIAQNALLLEATRMCEDFCDRRLAPFTLTDSRRADSLDVEDALDAYVPLDPSSQLGFSRALSLGSTLLVRHFWVREYPQRFPEMWTGAMTSILLRRSFSGDQNVDTSQIQFEPDTGHVRFQLGTFVPPGSTIVSTYSGGYSSVPSGLMRAQKNMTASIILRELQPSAQTRDPKQLVETAERQLLGYMRGGSRVQR